MHQEVIQLDMTQPGPFPTSTDIDRALDRLLDAPEDLSSLLPPSYTFISKAGSGTYGNVYFCLPTSVVTSARTEFMALGDSTTVYEDLTKQLVAVKTSRGSSIPMFQNEIKALQIVGATNQAAESYTRSSTIT